ncbi:MAG: ribosomal protein L13e [Candidatus Thorarchaeota archaeon]
MSFDIIPVPIVRSPRDEHPREGRGFSRDEIAKAGLTVRETRDMGLIVDLRRKTSHQENIDALSQYIKDIKTVAKAVKAEAAPSSAKLEAISVLSSLRAVSKANAQKLVDAGIKTIEDLAYCEITKVIAKTGIDEDALTTMVKAALKKV